MLLIGVLLGASCRIADVRELDLSDVERASLVSLPGADGVACGPAGECYVSSGSVVFRLEAVPGDGPRETWRAVPWSEAGLPRGHAIDGDGTHLVCDANRGEVLRLDADGRILGVAAAALSDPRDLCLDSSGGIFITDASGPAGGRLLRASADGAVRGVVGSLREPTGVALSRDGSTIYVAETGAGRLLACDVRDGEVGSPRVLASWPSDRAPTDLCVDAAGFVWVACGAGIDVVDSRGATVARVEPAEHGVRLASIAFGGWSLRTLFVAADRGVERWFVGARGAPLPPSR